MASTAQWDCYNIMKTKRGFRHMAYHIVHWPVPQDFVFPWPTSSQVLVIRQGVHMELRAALLVCLTDHVCFMHYALFPPSRMWWDYISVPRILNILKDVAYFKTVQSQDTQQK